MMRKYILIPEYRPLYAMRRCYGPTNGPLTRPTLTPIDVIGSLLKQTGNEQLSIYEVKMLPDGKTTKPVRLTLTNYTLPYDEILENPQVPDQPLQEVKAPKAVAPTPPPPPPAPKPVTVVEEPVETSTAVETTPEPSNTIVIVKDETPVEETTETVVEDTATVTEELQVEPAVAETVTTETPVEEPVKVDTVETEAPAVEEETQEEVTEAETTTTEDGIEIPVADPNDPVIQSGPYAGLTKAQKAALKAAKYRK